MIECVAGSGLLFVFCGFSFFCLVLNKNQFLISLNCAVLQLCIDFFLIVWAGTLKLFLMCMHMLWLFN